MDRNSGSGIGNGRNCIRMTKLQMEEGGCARRTGWSGATGVETGPEV